MKIDITTLDELQSYIAFSNTELDKYEWPPLNTLRKELNNLLTIVTAEKCKQLAQAQIIAA